MLSKSQALQNKFEKYHFELKHILVLFSILTLFLILISFVQKTSLQDLLFKTQKWYQQDSAERMANLTATSLELLLETIEHPAYHQENDQQRIIQAFNIILSQQKLQQNVQDVCILLSVGNSVLAIDNGKQLYDYFFEKKANIISEDSLYREAITLYKNQLRHQIRENEEIYSIPEGDQVFHVFVPFVPKGEYAGAVYVKYTPDFSFITGEIIASYDETALIFACLIILGLMAMFYISSFTVKERDETQKLLFQEREKYLLEKVEKQKEALFTKRIYHTHHKAEKVMGFIKEDLRKLSMSNIEDMKLRTIRYANFISRVIYDMKWYDPPIQVIRNPIFQTNLNDVICFIVDNIFMRTSNNVTYRFELDLDPAFPPVPINEFVVWEIIEPLIQNTIEHGHRVDLVITIKTIFDPQKSVGQVFIKDNGKGFPASLLATNEKGVKKLFLENVTTKNNRQNAGYGCYLAYEISTRRCGWIMDAENLKDGGCQFIITITQPLDCTLTASSKS